MFKSKILLFGDPDFDDVEETISPKENDSSNSDGENHSRDSLEVDDDYIINYGGKSPDKKPEILAFRKSNSSLEFKKSNSQKFGPQKKGF